MSRVGVPCAKLLATKKKMVKNFSRNSRIMPGENKLYVEVAEELT